MSGCKYRTGHLSDPPKTGSQYSERPSADHEEEILKKRIRINVFSIISTQHICCHGFSKPSRSAYTDKTLFRFQNGVGIRNQSTFININFGIQCHFIIFIARIKDKYPSSETSFQTESAVLINIVRNTKRSVNLMKQTVRGKWCISGRNG